MALTDKDPYNAREAAQIIWIAVQVERRRLKGKSVKALENKADRIRERAQEREDLIAAKRERERRAKAVKRYG